MQSVESRIAIAEKPARASRDEGAPGSAVAIFDERHKLVQNLDRPPGMAEFELYDRSADPLDRHDLAAEHPDVVERLSRELAAWRKVAERAKLKNDADAAATLSPEELERLRALGYIQ